MIVNDPCTLCTPNDEVGCVERDDAGLVACEGCRRERRQGDRDAVACRIRPLVEAALTADRQLRGAAEIAQAIHAGPGVANQGAVQACLNRHFVLRTDDAVRLIHHEDPNLRELLKEMA